MTRWTVELLRARFAEAAATLRRLPKAGMAAHIRVVWPLMKQEDFDGWIGYGREAAVVRLGPPNAGAITRLDETLSWLLWLDERERRLVWGRAMRTPWKRLALLDGRVPRMLQYAHAEAYAKILLRLDGTRKILSMERGAYIRP